MRIYILLIVSFLSIALPAQNTLFDTTIVVPHPETGQIYTSDGIFNNIKNTIYVCGRYGNIVECDAATHQPVNTIPIGFEVDRMLFNEINNKLYVSEYKGIRLAVIDCSINSILKYIQMPDTAYQTALALNHAGNKVYAGRLGVVIIDSETDQIIKEYPGEYHVEDIVVSEKSNKVYSVAGIDHKVLVFDGESNDLVKEIETDDVYQSLCYNSVNDRVYCGSSHGRLAVIEVATDELTYLNTGSWHVRKPIYNPESNKIYVGKLDSEDGMIIIDGETNELLKDIVLDEEINFLQFNSVNNTVYAKAFHQDFIHVVDGITDEITGTIPVKYISMESLYNPVAKSIIWFYSNFSLMEIIDATSHTPLPDVRLGMQPYIMCYNTTGDKLYVMDYLSDLVCVVDAKSNMAIKQIFLGHRKFNAQDMLYVPGHEKIYITHNDTNFLSVIDCNTDELLERITVGEWPCALSYCPQNHSIYCSNEWEDYISVINCENDQVTENIYIDGSPKKSFYHEGNNQLYVSNCWFESNLFIINCDDNSIEKTIECTCDIASFEFEETTNTLYIGSDWIGDLTVVNCTDNTSSTYEVVKRGYMHEMSYNPENDKMYFINRDSSTISILDLSDFSLLKTYETENCQPISITYQPEGNKIIAGCSGNIFDRIPGKLYVIDGATDELLQSVDCPHSPVDFLYDPKFQKTYMACMWYSQIPVINDTSFFSIPETIGLQTEPMIISVTPNPCNDIATIRYRLSDAGYYLIGLYTLDGKVIREISYKEYAPGEYEKKINVSDIPEGMYLAKLQMGGLVAFEKLIVKH